MSNAEPRKAVIGSPLRLLKQMLAASLLSRASLCGVAAVTPATAPDKEITHLTPWTVFKAAIKAVLALRYALGVLDIVSARDFTRLEEHRSRSAAD
jgi:hypothetical protein